MVCSNCGKTLRDGARFCPSCGQKQASAPARQTTTTTYTRFTRSEYWLGTVILYGIAVGCAFLGIVGWVFSAILFLFQLGLNIGRLHDVGKSGHYLWYALLPVFGWIYLFVQALQPSDGDNMYGPAPKVEKK